MIDALRIMQIIRVVRTMFFESQLDSLALLTKLGRSIDWNVEPANRAQGQAIETDVDPGTGFHRCQRISAGQCF